MRGLALIAAAVVAAIPFGWLLGVFAAELIVGPEFGVFPVLTIPFGLVAAVWFALSRIATPGIRLAALLLGVVGFELLL